MPIRFESNVEPLPGYRLLERLGSGGFGEVWKCVAPGDIFKAVKIIHGDLRSKDDDLVRYAEQELKAMKRVKAVRHPYLLAIDRYDIIEGRLLIVMELADCNLWDRFRQCRQNGLPGIPREDLLVYMQEAAEVLDLMNFEHQLMHLDIKPQNIFLQYNHVKVGDFGQVKDLEGIMASVTGGITPVYAAPETFDGMVTRYCDQYSLACVYQELLTGQRPFDGASMQQLLMQHLTLAPNLAPSPALDRPVLERALAKRPEDRFTNTLEFVKALKTSVVPPPVVRIKKPEHATEAWVVRPAAAQQGVDTAGGSADTSVATYATLGITATPLPDQLAEMEPPRVAPAERRGDGPIRPSLVIGVGGTGLRFLQRFRKQIADRFGGLDAIPAVRTLFIDTDPETLAAATQDRSQTTGLSPLKTEEVFAARLNRSTHYQKPRQTGRTLVDGWFDHQLLHRLTRNPLTMGVRALGRLALCDHYRALMQKIEAELDTSLTPEALHESMEATRLDLGSNRPRIYLAASLIGGTGGGMILDLAYILRNRLRRFGYEEADVVGMLFIPPDDPAAEYPPTVRANVVAALTELNHFSRPRCAFQSFYDDRHAFLRDAESPFARYYLMSLPLSSLPPMTPLGVGASRSAWSAGRSGSMNAKDMSRSGTMTAPAGRAANRQSNSNVATAVQRQALQALDDGLLEPLPDDPVMVAADWLRLELFGQLGRAAAKARPPAPPIDAPSTAGTWGLVRYEWPRTEIVARTARIISGVVLDTWVSPDPGRAREIIPGWTAGLWKKLSLDLEGFIERLRDQADATVKQSTEGMLDRIGEAPMPKAWLTRPPDAAQVGHALTEWDRHIGHPASGANRPLTPIEEALRTLAGDLATAGQTEIAAAVPRLIDDPKFRLAGSEEAARQLIADVNRKTQALNVQAEQLDKEAIVLYELLTAYAHGTGRAQQPATLGEALKKYPRVRFQAVLARRAARTYEALKEGLTLVKNDVASCRQRLLAFKNVLLSEIELPLSMPGPRQVMPHGCIGIEDASKRYLDILTDEDLQEIEGWVQKGIERVYGGVYEACLNTAEGASGLLDILRRQTRSYLNNRLGDVDLAAMFEQKFGSMPKVTDAFQSAYREAVPGLIGGGPWARNAVTVFAAPAGASGDVLRHAAGQAFPDLNAVVFADCPDEAIVYREYPQVPLAALPHFGPAWQSAYATALDAAQSPHTRIDIPQWVGIDVE